MSTGQRLKFWFAERFAMIVALLVLFYLFLPVLYTFVFSFNNYKKSNISWNPEGSPTLEHWQNPCGPPGLCESLGTSIKVGGIATLVATVLGTMLAFALVRHRWCAPTPPSPRACAAGCGQPRAWDLHRAACGAAGQNGASASSVWRRR